MRTPAWLCLALLASACAPAPPPDGAVDERTPASIHPLPRPPQPSVSWQFRDCLPPHQRSGLIAALQQLYDGTSELHDLRGLVGDSQCLSGEEKGGLFLATWTAAQRLAGLKALAIRPLSRLYAFQIGRPAIDAVALPAWANRTLNRFDELGNSADDGRYEIWGYTDQLASPRGLFTMVVVDRQTQERTDLAQDTYLVANDDGTLGSGFSKVYPSPALSPDPYVQPIINASVKFIAAHEPDIWFLWPSFWAFHALDFFNCPSLKGWPLPFDLVTVDAVGNLVAAGGDLIL